MLSFSVVVPVRNAARTLPDCLSALARLDPAPTEALLVDNGSTDRSLELLDAFARNWRTGDVQVLTEPRRGPAAARNAGVRRAKGDVIAFTDADCVPEVAWLHYLAEPFKDPIVGAVAGRVVAAPASSIPELFSALYTLKLPDTPARQHQWTPWEGGYPTANLAVRRRLLEDVGAFDERLRIGEDYDLCARLYNRGAEIAYVPAARVAHHHRTTLLGMLRQAFDFGQAHPCLLQRHAANGLWIDLPGRSFLCRRWPGRAWVDLASADKKLIAILAVGGAYRPALLLLPLYAVWLVMSTARRAREAGTPVSAAAIGLAVLLVLKSTAMTAGRWWGSLRYRAFCF